MPSQNIKHAQVARATAPPDKKQQAPTADSKSNGPADRVSMFPISASIWMSYSQEGQPFYSVSFQRCYKDADGKWQYSDNFYASDCLVLAECAKAAYHRIRELKDAERGSQERSA